MLTVAEKEQVTKLVATTVQPLVSEQLKTLLAEELPPLIADALKQNRTAHHQPTTAVKPPQSTAQPDTRTTSAKKSTLNWQTAGVIVLMVSAIIGGWWALEDRFEKKLEEVRQEVQETRQEINTRIEEINTRIDEINTRIDAIYQLLLEQRR